MDFAISQNKIFKSLSLSNTHTHTHTHDEYDCYTVLYCFHLNGILLSYHSLISVSIWMLSNNGPEAFF